MCIKLASFRHKFGAETVHAFLIFAIIQRVGIFQEESQTEEEEEAT